MIGPPSFIGIFYVAPPLEFRGEYPPLVRRSNGVVESDQRFWPEPRIDDDVVYVNTVPPSLLPHRIDGLRNYFHVGLAAAEGRISDEGGDAAIRSAEGKRLTYKNLTAPDFKFLTARFIRWREKNATKKV